MTEAFSSSLGAAQVEKAGSSTQHGTPQLRDSNVASQLSVLFVLDMDNRFLPKVSGIGHSC